MASHSFAIELTLTPAGRHIAFAKQMLEKVHVYRRFADQGGAWQQVEVNARSPYVDTEVLPPGTVVEYHVQHCTQQDAYEGHSNVVRTTIP